MYVDVALPECIIIYNNNMYRSSKRLRCVLALVLVLVVTIITTVAVITATLNTLPVHNERAGDEKISGTKCY